jgi:predicted small metal-binding protein
MATELTRAERLTKLDCPCGFSVQGHDDDELVRLVRTHAKQVHDHDVPERELREAIRPVAATAR